MYQFIPYWSLAAADDDDAVAVAFRLVRRMDHASCFYFHEDFTETIDGN